LDVQPEPPQCLNIAQYIALCAEQLRVSIASFVGKSCPTLHTAIRHLIEAQSDRDIVKRLNLLNHAYTGVHHQDVPSLSVLMKDVHEFLSHVQQTVMAEAVMVLAVSVASPARCQPLSLVKFWIS